MEIDKRKVAAGILLLLLTWVGNIVYYESSRLQGPLIRHLSSTICHRGSSGVDLHSDDYTANKQSKSSVDRLIK